MKLPALICVAIVSVEAAVLGRAGEFLKLDASGRYAAREVLVKFTDGPQATAAAEAHNRVGGTALRHFRACGWQHVKLPPGMTVEEGLAKYKNSPGVLAVEPNYVVRAIEPVPTPAPDFVTSTPESSGATPVTPNDPMFPSQWGLARIQAPEAWTTTTGNTNVVVVVMGDTGVNYRHEDLQANMWRNPGEIPDNAIDDDGNGYVDDVHGWDAVGEDGDPMDEGINGAPSNYRYHGTACAGIVGAVGNNGRGLAGVNWSVQLMAVRGTGTDNLTLITDTIEGFEYVTLMKRRGVNIRATSNSYYTDPNVPSQALRDAIDAAGNEGILHVFAAANDARDIDVNPRYPASYPSPSVIAVAASDMSDNLPSFSNWGRTNVDLAAPGTSIVTVSGATTNGYITNFGQTSGATPFVAGAVALLAAANSTVTAVDIKTALLESVDVLPAFSNKMVSNGRLNVARALERLGKDGPPAFFAEPQNRTVPVGSAATFTACAGGSRPLRYQWLFNGATMPEATNSTLSLTNLTFSDRGDYSVAVSNVFGSVTSAPAALSVVPLLITAQPRSTNVWLGSNVTLSVGVTSTVPFSCQWQRDGVPMEGETNLPLTLTNVQLADEGEYSVALANSFGSVLSAPATLLALIKPVIAQPPLSQAVVEGGSVTLSASIAGHPAPFLYSWRRGSTILSNIVLQERTSFFILSNIQTNQGGLHRLVVTNAASPGGVLVASFTLTVLPDTDADGLPDTWETAYGINEASANHGTADDDGDGLTNGAEYLAGTDPTNALSYPKIEGIRLDDGGETARLEFMAISNKTYTVQYREEVEAGEWQRLTDILAVSSNRVVEVTDPASGRSGTQRVYRLATPRVP